MDTLPHLEIYISAQRQVTLRFSDPTSGVAPNPYEGTLNLPKDLPRPEDEPIAYGRTLRDVLLGTQAIRDEFARALNLTIRATPPRTLRISLALATGANDLHARAWETLLDPGDDQPLLSRSRVHFSRFLASDEPIDITAVRPRALVFIANPERLANNNEPVQADNVRLHPVNVDCERTRALQGLRSVATEVISSMHGQKGVASLDRLLSALGDTSREPYQILYLVCHGAIYAGQSKLWLDELDDKPVDAQLLVDGLRNLSAERRPRLVVLASCQSAGQSGTGNEASIDRGTLAAIGPKLVQEAGIAAVVAMQDNIFMRTVETMMPAFFRELVRSGQVERAMTVARGRLRIHTNQLIRDQWRVPVLFSRLRAGQIWPAGQVKPQTVYLSHAVQAGDAEYEALTRTRAMLEDGGFEVVESAARPAAVEVWSQRLLDGLGTCDAAVLLLNERALIASDNWVPVEARILCWRHWLEPDFCLVPICLSESVQPRLQQAPWTLLCGALAPTLTGTTADELDEQLRDRLATLQQATQLQSRWRLSDLERRVAGHFKEMELDDILLAAAKRLQPQHGLPPLSQEAPVAWWARAVLYKGPFILSLLYDDMLNLISSRVKQAIKGLLGPVGPAWVDIAAAAQIVHLAARADQTPGSFYLRLAARADQTPGSFYPRGIELAEWVAYSYAARACGLDYFRFIERPGLLMVVPTATANDSERINQIRTALRERLEHTEPDWWKEAWYEGSDTESDDWFFKPVELVAADDQRVDAAIKRCVETWTVNRRPVLIVLSGATATRQQLLADVRQRFGPVNFFFMAKDLAATTTDTSTGLISDIPFEAAHKAHEEWNKLVGYMSNS
jgi:hypothetical protein